MDVQTFHEEMPYLNHLDISLNNIENGRAEGFMPVDQTKSWDSENIAAHGGALFSFADALGGAALRSVIDHPTPTVDMRIDYFSAARDDVTGYAEILKRGKTTSTVDVTIESANGEQVAEARGVYKVSPP